MARIPAGTRHSGPSWTELDASPGYRPEDATCRQGVDNPVDELRDPLCRNGGSSSQRQQEQRPVSRVAQRSARTWPTLVLTSGRFASWRTPPRPCLAPVPPPSHEPNKSGFAADDVPGRSAGTCCLRRIARGGMGEVFLASTTGHGGRRAPRRREDHPPRARAGSELHRPLPRRGAGAGAAPALGRGAGHRGGRRPRRRGAVRGGRARRGPEPRRRAGARGADRAALSAGRRRSPSRR